MAFADEVSEERELVCLGIFAVSTFNTDYILVKKENFERALEVLEEKGYVIVE